MDGVHGPVRARKIFPKKVLISREVSCIIQVSKGACHTMKRFLCCLLAVVLVLVLCGCERKPVEEAVAFVNPVQVKEIQDDEMAILSELPEEVPDIPMPEAPGTKVYSARKGKIDYSNADDGYVMVQFTEDSKYRLKCQVTGPDKNTYTYNLAAKQWAVFPFSSGNGKYDIAIYEETGENTSKYVTILNRQVTAKMSDEFAPFLLPNQYVNYEGQENTIAKAEELVGDKEALDAVAAVYDWVVTNLTYDREKARTVKSGYLPELDKVLESKTGICFDYASLMTAMLRSQGVPCKLVVGYAGDAYHAWISVWTEETGWIEDVIFFDGMTWQRMDPTFASSGNQSDAIMRYIGDGSHYKECYIY